MDSVYAPLASFSTSYQCFSLSCFSGKWRPELDNGGNIFLPSSALEHLSQLKLQYPMLFQLSNKKKNRITHCGVLEFVADEGRTYVPYWMLNNLLLEEGEIVSVSSVALALATFAKFQPQSVSFLEISNPKAVLEKALRGFSCLTVDDIIVIKYNNSNYELKVLETEPASAVTIINCDLRVDFAPCVGYTEKIYKRKSVSGETMDDNASLIPAHVQSPQVFKGKGSRLDGRERESPASTSDSPTKSDKPIERGVPNFDYQPGSLTFLRMTKTANNETAETFKAFEGEGMRLKQRKAKS